MVEASTHERDPLLCTIYHGANTNPADFGQDAERAARWRGVDELFEKKRSLTGAIVLVVDESMIAQLGGLRALPHQIIFVPTDELSAAAVHRRVHVSVADIREPEHRARTLRAVCELACVRATTVRRRRQLARTNHELQELNRIGLALMEEHDLAVLLQRIVDVGKRLTQSDACALMLADTTVTPAQLHLGLWDIDSLPDFKPSGYTVPVDDASIVGHAAKSREPMVIADAHDLPADVEFVINDEFDRRYGYWRRSMLIVPMTDRADRLVGELVFINRKTPPTAIIRSKEAADRYVLPYTERELRVARSLSSQAAVSIENAQLHARIERNLESFVAASVTALDQRDPTTAGHSLRVASRAARLAEAAGRATDGPYKDVRFTPKQMRELRFAALLHDFGKVGVREEVLVKAKKLPPLLWERVNARFDLIRRTMELDHFKRCPHTDDVALDHQLEDLERMRGVVRAANEPTVLDAEPAAALRDIARCTFEGVDGKPTPYLTADELHFLQIPHGTLDDLERREIQSHAEQTYQFLSKIPWTDDLKNLSGYAYGHHEMLNGSGYPRQLAGREIALQTRIITLADIFDALTASDRPYKPAVSVERALAIIQSEAKAGRLDAELVRVMMDSRAFADTENEAQTAS